MGAVWMEYAGNRVGIGQDMDAISYGLKMDRGCIEYDGVLMNKGWNMGGICVQCARNMDGI